MNRSKVTKNPMLRGGAGRRGGGFASRARARPGHAGVWTFCGMIVLGCPVSASVKARPGMQGRQDAARIAEGERVFEKACSVSYCHGRQGAAGRAPALKEKNWEAARLLQIVTRGIANTAMLNFDDKLTENQISAVVAYILSISKSSGPDASSADGSPPVPAGNPATGADSASIPDSLRGDPVRGERLFFESSGDRGCAGCHSIDRRGTAVGPDLSGSVHRNARDIFRKIVFPAAMPLSGVGPKWISMKDGEKILALEREKTATAVRVYDVGSQPPVLRRLSLDQIESIEPASRSAMPDRLAERYTLRELLDIVSFVKSSGAPAPVRVSFPDVW